MHPIKDIQALFEAAFPKPDMAGRVLHDVIHPELGKVDTIFISGNESRLEITDYEAAAFQRLSLTH